MIWQKLKEELKNLFEFTNVQRIKLKLNKLTPLEYRRQLVAYGLFSMSTKRGVSVENFSLRDGHCITKITEIDL
ncbi:IS3 family transposase [Paenibacillus sp. GP183]|uniref:IS3 family transposase n=1 Tax=Paenibacillus sp. GP183 TaxID=1882751 RepID=UPI000B8A175F